MKPFSTQPGLETRYTREAWLSTALEVLSREGQARLRTERLAADLGVTRGSFYHHFKSRADFVEALVDHWAKTFTIEVNRQISEVTGGPGVRLLALMRLIRDRRLDRFDIAFRSWAAQDPAVALKVREVDLERYGFIRSLFGEMGFKGDDREERVRLFLVHESAQHTLHFPEASRQIPDSLERRFALYTGRPPPTL